MSYFVVHGRLDRASESVLTLRGERLRGKGPQLVALRSTGDGRTSQRARGRDGSNMGRASDALHRAGRVMHEGRRVYSHPYTGRCSGVGDAARHVGPLRHSRKEAGFSTATFRLASPSSKILLLT